MTARERIQLANLLQLKAAFEIVNVSARYLLHAIEPLFWIHCLSLAIFWRIKYVIFLSNARPISEALVSFFSNLLSGIYRQSFDSVR